MKTDFYTKAVLTVIAVMLTLIAGQQLHNPASSVRADSNPVQFAVGAANSYTYVYRPSDDTVQSFKPDGKRGPSYTLGGN